MEQIIFCRDTLNTPAKCLQATREALAAGKSVVIDNTNPDSDSRAPFIEAAEDQKVPVRCFVFKTDIDTAQHLNYVRQTMTKGEIRRIPDVAYAMYKKRLDEPSKEEGFTEVKEIQFVPDFSDAKVQHVFMQYT